MRRERRLIGAHTNYARRWAAADQRYIRLFGRWIELLKHSQLRDQRFRPSIASNRESACHLQCVPPVQLLSFDFLRLMSSSSYIGHTYAHNLQSLRQNPCPDLDHWAGGNVRCLCAFKMLSTTERNSSTISSGHWLTNIDARYVMEGSVMSL